MPETNGKKLLNGSRLHLGWFVSGLLGASSGTVAIGVTPVGESLFRQDPATGTELDRVESRVDNHLLNHPDHELRRELAVQRALNEAQQRQIDRLEEKIDELERR